MRLGQAVYISFALATLAGCDLLNQTPVITEKIASDGIQAPLSLSRPDSVLKMLTYIFDRHTNETAQQFADLLYPGYVYRYDDPTDDNDLELDRASEIEVYKRVFRSFETISAEFLEEDEWVEYGSEQYRPPEVPIFRVSDRHPNENWTVKQVQGEMTFASPVVQTGLTNYHVRQRFELSFRLDDAAPDSVWQLAAWTDREWYAKPTRQLMDQ